jgi:hypothetical protein
MISSVGSGSIVMEEGADSPTGITAHGSCTTSSLDSYNAISREKQLKARSRRVKVGLIERINPGWKDLYCDIAGSVRIAAGAGTPSQSLRA